MVDQLTAGRIGLTIRVGVTGHRQLADPAAVASAVGSAIKSLSEDLPSELDDPTNPVRWAVVSALAEGADQVVAEELMRSGASLEVVLPLEPADYETDFETAE